MPHTRLPLAGAAALAALLLSGCSLREFAPASPRNRLFADNHTARAAMSGVVINARAGVWHGHPSDLPSRYTPVRLDLTNMSNHPLSVRYQDFRLANRYGLRSDALSPFRSWGNHLPTAGMTRHAIREGVLQPNGHLRGYLYFQHVPAQAHSVELDASLIDAVTHHQFATIEIPFRPPFNPRPAHPTLLE